MNRLIPPLLLLLLAAAGPAMAEKADAYKPTDIQCRICNADGITGAVNMDGGVTITRGSFRVDAERGRVESSPEGYQRAVLEAAPGQKVRFRQKADGPGEQWMHGEAERVEFDDKTSLLKLFSKAHVRREQNGKLIDESKGEFISYDSRKEAFSMRNTNTGEDRPGAGRNTIVIQPTRTAPAAAGAAVR
jgi:lipopolysaccharide export system protein LptA